MSVIIFYRKLRILNFVSKTRVVYSFHFVNLPTGSGIFLKPFSIIFNFARKIMTSLMGL